MGLNFVSAKREGARLAKLFHAWWEGYEVPKHALDDAHDDGEAVEGPLAAGFDDRSAAAWSDPRYRVNEQVWGAGFIDPGGSDYVAELIRPLGLDSTMKVVELGAALGGASRTIHTETGAWVTGYEESELSAEAGMELSTIAGLAKKAPILHYDPENLELRDESLQAIFSREAFYKVSDKQALLNKTYEGLRPLGQLLFTDYAYTGPGDAGDPAVSDWLEAEQASARPWSFEALRAALDEIGFEVRITEDTTPKYREMVLDSWKRFTLETSMDDWDGRSRAALAAAVNLWVRRLAALESGEIGVFRVLAIKPSGPVMT